jgi:two-component system, NtrC family, sensor kinase
MAALDDGAIDHRQTIAALRRELDQRTAERDEALAQQLATSEILEVISRSPTDTQPVFEAIVAHAAALCEAEFSAVARLEDGLLHLVAVHSMSPEETAAFHSLFPRAPEPNVVMGRAFVEAQPVHFDDVLAELDYDTRTVEVLQSVAKYRSFLGVPIFREARPIGVIGCGRREVRPFSAAQIDLVKTLADQAAIAIENVRLFGDLDARNRDLGEALAQQTATAQILEAINRSPGNLAPVFEAMVGRAVQLCEADEAAVRSFDGELLHLVAAHGEPDVLDKLRELGPSDLSRPGGLYEPFTRGERVVHIADVRETETFRNKPIARKRLEMRNIRTWLAVALRREGTLLGIINVHRHEVRPFSENQIALLENFAAQAVVAIENARLLTELRESLEQQQAIAEVLQVINSSPGDLAPVFDAMLEKAMRLCEAAFGGMWTLDRDRYIAVALRNVPTAYADFLAKTTIVPGPGTAPYRFLQGERLVHNVDLASEEPYKAGDPQRCALVDLGGARTALQVPLRKDDHILGVIMIYRQEIRPFSDKQVTLLENFAAQAVIAMENARLLTETREALEQQTATAEVLQVINSSPGDLAPVFDAMLDKALGLCGAAFGVLWTYDGERIHADALRGVPPAFAEFLTRAPHPVRPDNAHGRLLRGEPVVHIPDVAEDEAYWAGDPIRHALLELGRGRTLLGVPLRKDDAFLGDFVIYRQEVRPFSDRQITLLQNFAAQAVIAMANARLITETREALDQQTATSEVLGVINSSPGDLAPVFDAMLEKAMRLCDAAFGQLAVFEDGRFRTAATRGMPEAFVEYRRTNPPDYGPGTQPARLLAGERIIHIADMRAEEVYAKGEPNRRALVDLGGVRTSLMVPLLRDDAVLGFINFYRQEVRPFSDKQIALLQNFAAQAVIAIENARLLDEIRQRQAELHVTFENMGDGVAMFDPELRLAAWNHNFQRILDLPDALLAERPSYAEYIRTLAERGEFGSDGIEAELSRRLEDTEQELRLERTRPDGRVIEVRRNTVPGGGFVLIYGDVTERKRSEAAIRAARDAAEAALRELKTAQASLIHAEKMASLGQLTAGIAHEIKNPLNFVNNFAGLSVELLDELKEAAAPAVASLADDIRAEIDDIVGMLTGNLEKIAEHGRRADGIVKSMLAHSRGGSSERQAVDINSLVDESLNLAYHGARAQDQNFNIMLERDLDHGIAPIELVPQDVTRVFLNLFGNGFYAAHKRCSEANDRDFKPSLRVTTHDLGEAVEVRVRDNGTGIAPEVRDKLFQPFFTTKPTGEGTGLGLSISWDIVTQQHGGTIEVDSEVGEFTEFTIRLPRGQQATTAGKRT